MSQSLPTEHMRFDFFCSGVAICSSCFSHPTETRPIVRASSFVKALELLFHVKVNSHLSAQGTIHSDSFTAGVRQKFILVPQCFYGKCSEAVKPAPSDIDLALGARCVLLDHRPVGMPSSYTPLKLKCKITPSVDRVLGWSKIICQHYRNL